MGLIKGERKVRNSNLEFLKENKITPVFYYNNHESVCLLINEDKKVLARGVSICSYRDQFIKKIGRAKAMGRAIKAYKNRQSSDPIRFDWCPDWSWLASSAEKFKYKSNYNPIPSMQERELLSYRGSSSGS